MRGLICLVVMCILVTSGANCYGLSGSVEDETAPRCYPVPPRPIGFENIEHIIVIYQENWSFDSLYGNFPNRDVEPIQERYPQVDFSGKAPEARNALKENFRTASDIMPKIPKAMTVRPYSLADLVGGHDNTGDLVHAFYTEQNQINGGRMDHFYAGSDNPGLVMSRFDVTKFDTGRIAMDYTLCDRFFHAAFGGSFLNHQFLAAARAPLFLEAQGAKLRWDKDDQAARLELQKPREFGPPFSETKVTYDGFGVNTLNSVYPPNDPANHTPLIPGQTHAHIGDRMNNHCVSWAWYAEGYKHAMQGDFSKKYQLHHQPFVYFNDIGNNPHRDAYLRDEEVFEQQIDSGGLPQVSFVKFIGEYNEHPGYTNVADGETRCANLIKKIHDSRYWNNSVIIVAYDEHGGRWDHIAPPDLHDRFGPGTRVPCIIISRWAKRHFIDHTQYTTCSILKFIESRFGLRPLTFRDNNANNFENAFDFEQSQ